MQAPDPYSCFRQDELIGDVSRSSPQLLHIQFRDLMHGYLHLSYCRHAEFARSGPIRHASHSSKGADGVRGIAASGE